MSKFHTKSQKRASKLLMLRNDAVMKQVSENLQLFDADVVKNGGVRDFVARDAFAKMCLERAQTSIVRGPPY